MVELDTTPRRALQYTERDCEEAEKIRPEERQGSVTPPVTTAITLRPTGLSRRQDARAMTDATKYSDWNPTLADGIDPDSRIAKTIKAISAQWDAAKE